MKRLICLSSVVVFLSAVGTWGCGNKKSDSKGSPGASASASAGQPTPTASASASPDTSAPATAATLPGAVPLRKIPAGPAPNGTWTIEFEIERIPGDENLDWSAALAHCQEKGRELCLETQWQRACELDPALGALPSWTLTADYPGAAVRGGADGCKSRVFSKVNQKAAERIGLCCSRAIAVSSDDKTDEFRTSATKVVLEFEGALQKGTPDTLGKALASTMSLDGTDLDRASVLGKLQTERKADPTRLAFYDHCAVNLSKDETPQRLIADCGVILRTLGRTQGFTQRIAFSTATGGAVNYLGDPKNMKPKDKKEQKERVNSFLPSE